MSGYGLVLSGGGAKGSYEVGVWKAIEDLDIPICAITGTSIGALNGAMLVQGDIELLELAWSTLSVEHIIDVKKDVWESEKMYEKRMTPFKFFRNTLNGDGLDISPLTNLLRQYIDEDRIRNSPIDLGIVTFSLTDRKPLQIFKDEMPKNQIVDYLVASACFPAFKPIEIDNKKYIDGGFYDNIPIAPLVERGIRDIIVVDISGGFTGVPVVQRGDTIDDYKDCNIIVIQSTQDLGKTLEIDPERSRRNIQIGYMDAMKTFDIIGGKRYYIIPPLTEEETKTTSLYDICMNELQDYLGVDSSIIMYKMIKTIYHYMDKDLPIDIAFTVAMAEITAEELEVGINKIYTLDDLNSAILCAYEDMLDSPEYRDYTNRILSAIAEDDGKPSRKSDRTLLSKIRLDRKYLPAYLYNARWEEEKDIRFKRLTYLTYPKTAIASIYLYRLLDSIACSYDNALLV